MFSINVKINVLRYLQGEKRIVNQFQCLSWPDKQVIHPLLLVNLRRHVSHAVNHSQGQGPLVVHCRYANVLLFFGYNTHEMVFCEFRLKEVCAS
jgi:hypothetical protein